VAKLATHIRVDPSRVELSGILGFM